MINGSVLDKIQLSGPIYVVAQGVNGMTYTGKTVGVDLDLGVITVEYERDDSVGTKFKTDLFLNGLCSLQETSKEEIKRVRDKREKRGS